ncbi:glycosyl hydrolase [Granulicella sp. dw_53]|uniref:glycosyl hydrolase n=1 Tax=Granulicella sp. dw_53 TaxID=2719792 RepID=UPI001BD2B715|nr:glycosyl hydrolase [Granulicella sp. dw_53]
MPSSSHIRCIGSILLACLVSFSLSAQAKNPTSLDQGFHTPPATARPWVFWMWLRVETTHEAITADLEAMHSKGIEGAILYDSGVGGGMEATQRMVVGHKEYRREPTSDFADAHFTPIPEPPMPSWQPKSREMVRFAAKEAARLGVKLVLTVGLASTSGDIALEDSQQRLIWSETTLNGGEDMDILLAAPKHAVPTSRVSVVSMVAERSEVGDHPETLHPIVVLAMPDRAQIASADVIDISSHVDAAGRLHWSAPNGKWRVLRFCYEPTRMTNAWGLYTDAMRAQALDHTWNATIGRLLQEMTPDERRGLYGIEDDSWEAGASTWTMKFAAEFQRRRGYDLKAWLPALAGVNLGGSDEADGVRRDYYRTVADLIAENHYAHLAELARRNGLVSYSEAAGPNSGELDPEQNAAHINVPMGEFWVPSQHRPTPDRRFLTHDAASSGHVYGQRIIGCESFTSVGPHWEDTFFDMKDSADQGFTEGCNLNFIHNFSQSPSVTARPGYVYFAGTHYERGTTWWDQTPAFNTYLGRAAFLLQQGRFTADVLYYRGDAIGQLEQRKKSFPAPGYDHDNINVDALLLRVSTHNGLLALPDGMTYRILVLPSKDRMALEALRKIASLVDAGAVVVGPPPAGMAGLMTSYNQQRDFDALVTKLWGGSLTDRLKPGRIFSGDPIEALKLLHLRPDFAFTDLSEEGEIDWIHRHMTDTDIYYVTSRWTTPEKIAASFRITGRQPELWDPVTGEIRDAPAFIQHDGVTTVPLVFKPRGSMFVIFRRKIASTRNGSTSTNEFRLSPILTLTGTWQVSFDAKLRGPAQPQTFNKLTDWTTRPESGIRYYSGEAVYRKQFHLGTAPVRGQKLLLNLGEVHEEAEVRLNGKMLGMVWTKPARIDISSAARKGENDLEIKVVNLWPNRLIGDASLPTSERLTETNAHKFNSETPLYPSGLIGPVVVEIAFPPARVYKSQNKFSKAAFR